MGEDNFALGKGIVAHSRQESAAMTLATLTRRNGNKRQLHCRVRHAMEAASSVHGGVGADGAQVRGGGDEVLDHDVAWHSRKLVVEELIRPHLAKEGNGRQAFGPKAGARTKSREHTTNTERARC
jgi:hypothetical protein